MSSPSKRALVARGIGLICLIGPIRPIAAEPAPVELPAPTGPYPVGTTAWRVTELLGKPSPLLAGKMALPEVARCGAVR